MVATYTVKDFPRDLVLGDKGEDVHKMQQMLIDFQSKHKDAVQFKISDEALKQQLYDDSTKEAAEKVRRAAMQSPDMLKDEQATAILKLIMQFIFHTDIESLAPENGVGNRNVIRHYSSAREYELDALGAGALAQRGEPTSSSAANFALKLVGQREEPGNRGPLVSFLGGRQGLPWCGSFVDKAMTEAYGTPKVYAQANTAAAISFKDEAEKYGAFHGKKAGYMPLPGDVVVFSRPGGNHVGIVSGVKDGIVSYVAGNTSNSVGESTFKLDSPPSSLRGYAATEELAAAKNISIQRVGNNNSYIAANAKGHKVSDYARG